MTSWTGSVTLATIFVSDLEAALEFYTNTLGLENISHYYDRSRSSSHGSHGLLAGVLGRDPPPGAYPPPGAELSPVGAEDRRGLPLGGIVIALRKGGDNDGKSRKISADARIARSWAVLGLRTDDLIAKYRELSARGVEFVLEPVLEPDEPPSRHPYSQQLICAAFLDTDGNIIWLEEQLEEGDPGPVELQRWTSRE